jgi:hypothetical protein
MGKPPVTLVTLARLNRRSVRVLPEAWAVRSGPWAKAAEVEPRIRKMARAVSVLFMTALDCNRSAKIRRPRPPWFGVHPVRSATAAP